MILDSLVTIGRDATFLQANGISSDWEWWSEPFSLGMVDNFSVQINPLAETPVAMLFVPSTLSSAGNPSKIGILYVAQAPGVTNITITHSAPAGSATTVSVSTHDITVAPAAGATDAQVAMLVNQNAAAFALVKAFPVGWLANGPVLSSFESNVEDLAQGDVVLAFAKTTLGNNAAAAAQNGVASLDLSNDLVNWQVLTGGSAAVSASNGPAIIPVQASAFKFGRLHWLPNTGSVGQLSGLVSGKGAVR